MAKKTMALVLVTALLVMSGALSANAGWTQDGFAPCMLSVASDSHVTKYQVKRGDTVWEIARAVNVDVDVVLAMNNLDENSVIHEGQYLEIPGDRQKLHRIRAGDTLWELASMYQVSLDQLTAVNNIKDPNRLRVGQVIKIPAQLSMTRAAAQAPSRGFVNLFAWPVFGKISSTFGWRKGSFHHGLDIACPMGTPIRAAQAGRVTFVGSRPVYGKTVIINHGNGIESLYAHAAKTMVKEGQQVKKGQVIALVGVTGRTTGPHLHFQVNQNGKPKNPANYLR